MSNRLTDPARLLMKLSIDHALVLRSLRVSTGHLLGALTHPHEKATAYLLAEIGIHHDHVMEWLRRHPTSQAVDQDDI